MVVRSFVAALALVPVLTLAPLFAAAPVPDVREVDADSVQEFMDVGSWLMEDAEIEAWHALVINLRRNFDDICGDTFCEGEYSNVTPLRYLCSVEKTAGTIGRCVWLFAASHEEISPSTGRVITDVQVWRCRVPVARGTRVSDLLSALAGDLPLYAELPGTDRSIYDGLTTCL